MYLFVCHWEQLCKLTSWPYMYVYLFVGHREQLNQLTSWLDASQIYGSTQEEVSKLRDHTNHR